MLLRKARMKSKSKTNSCNYDENILEDMKENGREAIVSKHGRKKDINKYSKQFDVNSLKLSSKNLKKDDRETSKSLKGANENIECVDKFQKDSILITKEVQIVLRRHEENFDTLKKVNKISKSLKFSDSSKTAKTEEKKKRENSEVINVSKEPGNIESEDKFHSSFLTKEVKVVLKRHDVKNLQSCDPSDILLEDDNGKSRKVPKETAGGSKRKRGKQSESESDLKPTKSRKEEKESDKKSKGSSKKDKIPDVTAIDFRNDSKSPSGNLWNFKISSWNINGIRAWLEKNGLSYLHHEQPDIMCIQETKCSDDKLPEEVKEIEGYHVYWLSGDKEGYSGVGLLSKEKPIKVEYGIGISEHDNEGRVITAEYDQFYLVTSYVPNAGRGLVRLDYRMKWDKDFRAYLKKLDAKKPVILCGDLNVAHEEIDLANPKTNKKNAGFTKEEREGFSSLLEEGFSDTFRYLYPDVKGAYTFWTYMMNARAKNVGWRLDYFVISERFSENLCDNVIRKDVFGSDHCPITLFLSF